MWTYQEMSLAVKVSLIVLAIVFAVQLAPRRVALVRRLKRRVRRLAHRPWLCCAVIVGLSLGLSALLTAMRYPLPWTHDEFSYLLASDTFAHGRITNPTHPFWQHFETYHVLPQPSYMSKYPAGNGMALALGQWLIGHAIVGAWISLAVACAAVYWMFRGWLSPHWAAMGGLVVACHAPLLRTWGQSYWGGAVALLGGALVFGALRRIWREPKTVDSCLLGVGLVVLAHSRPLEGLLASIPVAISLLVWWFNSGDITWRRKWRQVAVPVGCIGLLGLWSIAAYNQAVTGEGLSLPYKVHDQTYSASSLLIWQEPPPPPQYNHPRMEQFYDQWGRQRQLSLREPGEYLANLGRKFRLLWDFTPLALGVCLLALPWVWRRPWFRFAAALVAGILVLQTPLATSWMYPHYLAPIVALFLALNVQCLRQLRLWQRSRGWGLLLGRAVLIFAILKLIPTVIDWQKPTRLHPHQFALSQLEGRAGPHLVFVSYDPNYRIVDEWVYNRAEIDRAPVVWARDMGEAQNAKLIEYFADRKVWRWHLVDDENMLWSPYDPAGLSENVKPTRP